MSYVKGATIEEVAVDLGMVMAVLAMRGVCLEITKEEREQVWQAFGDHVPLVKEIRPNGTDIYFLEGHNNANN